MKISELIKILDDILSEYGDLPVYTDSEDSEEAPIREDFIEVREAKEEVPERLFIG